MKEIPKDWLIVGAGRVGQIFLALVSMRAMTWLLSGAEVGRVYLILSLASCFSLAFVSPVGLYINRRLHKWQDEGSVLSHFSSYNIYIFAVSAAAIPVLYFAKSVFGVGAGIGTAGLCFTAAGFIYFGTWNSTLIPALNMLNYRVAFVALSTATLLLSFIFSVFLITAAQKSALLWLSGQIGGLFLLSIAALVYLRKKVRDGMGYQKIKGTITLRATGGIYKFSAPLVITSFFMWLQTQSYRVIVEKKLGAEFLGMMAVGLGIAAAIGAAVESLLQQVYYPVYYEEINTDDPQKRKLAWQKMAGIMMPLYLLVMLFVSFLASHLVTVLLDAKFRAAAFFTIFGAWIEFSRITTNLLSSVAHSEMRTDHLAKPYIYGGLITTAGVFAGSLSGSYRYLVPSALVLGGAVNLYLMLRNMRKLMPLSINRAELKLTLLLALPMPLALFVRNPGGLILSSLATLSVFGLYLVWAQYYLYGRISAEAGFK